MKNLSLIKNIIAILGIAEREKNMNKLKLFDYELKGSIHTIELKTKNELAEVLDDKVKKCIKRIEVCDNQNKIVLNLNRYEEELYTFTDFLRVFLIVMEALNIKSYTITRVDFRLDSFDDNHYQLFAKLNKYIISLFATTYSVRNAYKTVKLFSEKQLSVAVKNKYFEVENYDKNEESMGIDKAKSRLELRSKGMDLCNVLALPDALMDSWDLRISKLLENTFNTHDKYNRALAEVYLEHKDKRPLRFRDVTDFVMQKQDSFFMKSQLIKFIEMVDPNVNAKRKAENYKARYGIEYFQKRDLVYALETIKGEMCSYFAYSDLSEIN